MHKENEIDKLISLFSKLPGLGQRSARRIVLHLMQEPEIRLRNLVNMLVNVENKIVSCDICGNFDVTAPCNICSDETRDSSVIAVVETVADLWAMERSNVFRGHYHVLGNVMSLARNLSDEALRLSQLLSRCFDLDVKEVIIATNSTIEGQTVAFFITEFLKGKNIYVSRLASGIPIGGELDYLDQGTLSAALTLRQQFGD